VFETGFDLGARSLELVASAFDIATERAECVGINAARDFDAATKKSFDQRRYHAFFGVHCGQHRFAALQGHPSAPVHQK